MPRIKPLLVLCAALLTVTPAASADVNSDMNQFFNKLGFASNTTQPGVWQGQAAGYAYGGSLYARTQVKNVQLISMTLPDINAGSVRLHRGLSAGFSPGRRCPSRKSVRTLPVRAIFLLTGRLPGRDVPLAGNLTVSGIKPATRIRSG